MVDPGFGGGRTMRQPLLILYAYAVCNAYAVAVYMISRGKNQARRSFFVFCFFVVLVAGTHSVSSGQYGCCWLAGRRSLRVRVRDFSERAAGFWLKLLAFGGADIREMGASLQRVPVCVFGCVFVYIRALMNTYALNVVYGRKIYTCKQSRVQHQFASHRVVDPTTY